MNNAKSIQETYWLDSRKVSKLNGEIFIYQKLINQFNRFLLSLCLFPPFPFTSSSCSSRYTQTFKIFSLRKLKGRSERRKESRDDEIGGEEEERRKVFEIVIESFKFGVLWIRTTLTAVKMSTWRMWECLDGGSAVRGWFWSWVSFESLSVVLG